MIRRLNINLLLLHVIRKIREAKRRDIQECNMIVFFHNVNLPLSTHRFFKLRSPLFHTTINEIQRKLIALNNKGTPIAHFFRPSMRKNRIYASDYSASERMRFACAANVYASGTVHRVVKPLSSPSNWIVVAVTVPTRTNPHFTCRHQGKHEQTQNRE